MILAIYVLGYRGSVRVNIMCVFFFFFQAEDGIRDLVRSRGLGDVYKRQTWSFTGSCAKRPVENTKARTSRRERFIAEYVCAEI